ncbi:hypothetical protein HN011_007773 [Eciton burchellii]|nr:hypothetical protein HN011_007773 [Eciton burchellii]
MTDNGATGWARRRLGARETTTATRGERNDEQNDGNTCAAPPTLNDVIPPAAKWSLPTYVHAMRHEQHVSDTMMNPDCVPTVLLATHDRALNLETSSVPVSRRSEPAAVAEAPDSSGGETRTRTETAP